MQDLNFSTWSDFNKSVFSGHLFYVEFQVLQKHFTSKIYAIMCGIPGLEKDYMYLSIDMVISDHTSGGL